MILRSEWGKGNDTFIISKTKENVLKIVLELLNEQIRNWQCKT